MKYTDSHEWVRVDGAKGTIGISAHAKKELGEIVYIELPEVGKIVKAGDEIAIVESTKAAADIYAPVSGKIIKVNSSLRENLSALNDFPETEGWLIELELSEPSEFNSLLDPAAYHSILA